MSADFAALSGKGEVAVSGKSSQYEEAQACFKKHLAALMGAPLETLTGGENPAETFKKMRKRIVYWRLWHHLSAEEMAVLVDLPVHTIRALEDDGKRIDPVILCYLVKRLGLDGDSEESAAKPIDSCERFLLLPEPSLFQDAPHARYLSAKAVTSIHADKDYGIFVHVSGFLDPFVLSCPVSCQQEVTEKIVAWLAMLFEEDCRILDTTKLMEDVQKRMRLTKKKER